MIAVLALAGLSSGAHARPGSSKSAPVTSKGAVLSAAYPGESVDSKTVAKAIATFERTVVSG